MRAVRATFRGLTRRAHCSPIRGGRRGLARFGPGHRAARLGNAYAPRTPAPRSGLAGTPGLGAHGPMARAGVVAYAARVGRQADATYAVTASSAIIRRVEASRAGASGLRIGAMATSRFRQGVA